MKRFQLLFIVLTLLIGGGTYFLTRRRPAPVPPAPPTPPVMMLLAASRDLPAGARIEDADVEWIKAPEGGETDDRFVSPDNEKSKVKEQAISSHVRTPISRGEPIRRSRLTKSGLMAIMLAPGRRAVAIDVTPNTTAGGFILPNDRVDVLRTFRNVEASQDAGREVFTTERVLENVRVLAIGVVTARKDSEATVTGPTATLELTPHQAEIALMAQKSGQLSLTLRPVEEPRIRPQPEPDDAQDRSATEGATIVRRGVVSTLRAR